MACLRAAFNVFFYPQRLVTQGLQRGMCATALVSVSVLFSCPDVVELVRVRGRGPFRLTHKSLGVMTYKKKEGCPDDKRDEEQQVSISQDLRAPKAACLKPSSAPKTARPAQAQSKKTFCLLLKASPSPSPRLAPAALGLRGWLLGPRLAPAALGLRGWLLGPRLAPAALRLRGWLLGPRLAPAALRFGLPKQTTNHVRSTKNCDQKT
jgi:hypothetical protein